MIDFSSLIIGYKYNVERLAKLCHKFLRLSCIVYYLTSAFSCYMYNFLIQFFRTSQINCLNFYFYRRFVSYRTVAITHKKSNVSYCCTIFTINPTFLLKIESNYFFSNQIPTWVCKIFKIIIYINYKIWLKSLGSIRLIFYHWIRKFDLYQLDCLLISRSHVQLQMHGFNILMNYNNRLHILISYGISHSFLLPFKRILNASHVIIWNTKFNEYLSVILMLQV